MIALMAHMAGVVAMAAAVSVHAQNESPDAIVRSTVDEVLSVIRETKDPNALVELAEKKVLPRFDFRRMTQLAAAPARFNGPAERARR